MTTNAGRTTIYASARFVKRLKCTVSLSLDKPVQAQNMDGWSGDILKVGRSGEVAVMMHDASLATIIVPLKGVRHFDALLPVFLQRVTELWEMHLVRRSMQQIRTCSFYAETTGASSAR